MSSFAGYNEIMALLVGRHRMQNEFHQSPLQIRNSEDMLTSSLIKYLI